MFVQLGLVLLLLRGLLAESDVFGGDTRIVGGQDAPNKLYMYQVSIRKHRNNSEWHTCGGSVIHKEWILTASHCTYGIDAKALSIVVGAYTLRSGGDRYTVKKIINHEKYVERYLKNDIALIKIDGEIKMNWNVEAIKLRKDPVVAGTTCAFTGWGKIDNHGTAPNYLQAMLLESISNKDCKKQLRGSNFLPIDDKQLCLRAPSQEGACSIVLRLLANGYEFKKNKNERLLLIERYDIAAWSLISRFP